MITNQYFLFLRKPNGMHIYMWMEPRWLGSSSSFHYCIMIPQKLDQAEYGKQWHWETIKSKLLEEWCIFCSVLSMTLWAFHSHKWMMNSVFCLSLFHEHNVSNPLWYIYGVLGMNTIRPSQLWYRSATQWNGNNVIYFVLCNC